MTSSCYVFSPDLGTKHVIKLVHSAQLVTTTKLQAANHNQTTRMHLTEEPIINIRATTERIGVIVALCNQIDELNATHLQFTFEWIHQIKNDIIANVTQIMMLIDYT